jgi:hypothetical protein
MTIIAAVALTIALIALGIAYGELRWRAGQRHGYTLGKHGIIAKGKVEITRKARPEPLVI